MEEREKLEREAEEIRLKEYLQSLKQEIIQSAKRPSGEGSGDSRGLQALKKHIDRPTGTFSGEKTESNVRNYIDEIFDNPDKTMLISDDGQVLDIRGPNGQGIRFENGEFKTFLDPKNK